MSANLPPTPRGEADSVKDHLADGLTAMLSIWKLGGLSWGELLRRTWCQFWEDRILDQSAKLSFYLLLSIFPLLLFLIALLGLLLQSGPVLQETLHKVLQWPLLLGFVLMAFNILYLYAPNVKHRRWHWLMPGTVVGVVLWLMVSFGFKLYLSLFDRFTLAYGSIGAVITLLLWLYLSGTAILIGGEVNSEIEKASVGKPRSG